MKTEAVMCMEFTRTSPSVMPLSARASSTSPVMFTRAYRRGVLKWSTFLNERIRASPPLRAYFLWQAVHRALPRESSTSMGSASSMYMRALFLASSLWLALS